MAWGSVSWATQDVISLTKMTQINNNAIDNRKRSTFEMIVNSPEFALSTDVVSSVANANVWLEIDGTQYGIQHNHDGVTNGSGSEDDIDISGLANGIHTITL